MSFTTITGVVNTTTGYIPSYTDAPISTITKQNGEVTLFGAYTVTDGSVALVSSSTYTSVVPASVTTPTSSEFPISSTTTAAPANSTSSSVSGSSSKGKFGDGAIAGAAVGCFIGGALIAGLLVWILMSRRQKKHRSSGAGFASQRHATRPSSEKPLPVVNVAGSGVTGNWEKHLDQPESDGTIARSVKGLFDHIEVHVENFYRDANVQITPELRAHLLQVNSDYLPDSVAGLLPQSERPTMLIKHCLAQSILQHITPESEIHDSFLPTDFTALPVALSTRRNAAEKPAFNQAIARWRVLSSYLRPKPAEDPAYIAARDVHITTLADLLCRTFDPWTMSHGNFTSRRDNLISIMKSASETGILLFSQPSSFKWRWSIPESRSGRLRIVLLPGLEKVKDENARELERALELLRPVTGNIIG